MAEESVGERNRSNAFVVSARKRTLQKVAKTAGEGVLFSVAFFVAVIVILHATPFLFFRSADSANFFPARTGTRPMNQVSLVLLPLSTAA